MNFFAFCLTFVYFSGIILCTELDNVFLPESSKTITDKKYNEMETENNDTMREFCEKYDFCSLINTIKDVQDRLEINDMKNYARFTCAKFLNILKELYNESEKVKDLSIYFYVYNFLSNTIYLIDSFLNTYEKNLNNNQKFPQEAIKRVSTNFEHVERMFSVVENLINNIGNTRKISDLNFIVSGVFGLRKYTDVMVKIFNRCKTSCIIDYQNHNSIIIKQLTELKEQLKKIKNELSATGEFNITNYSELLKKDFVNSASAFYQNLIKCYQNDIKEINLFFDTLEDTLNSTRKSIDELESYKEVLSRQ